MDKWRCQRVTLQVTESSSQWRSCWGSRAGGTELFCAFLKRHYKRNFKNSRTSPLGVSMSHKHSDPHGRAPRVSGPGHARCRPRLVGTGLVALPSMGGSLSPSARGDPRFQPHGRLGVRVDPAHGDFCGSDPGPHVLCTPRGWHTGVQLEGAAGARAGTLHPTARPQRVRRSVSKRTQLRLRTPGRDSGP